MKKGTRIRYSAEGLRSWPKRKERLGTIIGQPRGTLQQGCWNVKWDNFKTITSIADRFIEEAKP